MAKSDARYAKHTWIHLDTPGSVRYSSKYVKLHGPSPEFFGRWFLPFIRLPEQTSSEYILIPQTVYCWCSQCCLKCVRLGWDAVSASLVLACSCLPTCLPSWDAASVSLVSPSLVSGLVSQLVSHLGWDAVFASWSRLSLVSGLVSQLVSGLGCCVRLPSLGLLLSPILSPNLSPILAGMLNAVPTCLPS